MKLSGWAVFGTLVLGLGTFGVYNAVMSYGRPEVEKRDVMTTGVITRVHGTEISHQLTKFKLNTQFNFDYRFTAEDGKEYSNSTIINGDQFRQLSEGQEISVRYHSHNPSVNASVPFGHYVSVGQMPKSTPQFRLLFSLGFCCFGGLIIFLALRDQQCPDDVSPVTDQRFHAAYSGQINR